MLEIQVLAWDRHKNVTGLNRLMGSQPSPLDKWISKRQCIYKQHAPIRSHTTRPHTITKMNDNINI